MNYNINYNRVILFDGSYCLHRALSVPNYWDMKNSKGVKTGGVLGVIKTIIKELKTYNYFPIVVFDGGLSTRRLNIFPNYKRNLEKQQLLECLQEDKTEQQLLDEEFMYEYRNQRGFLLNLLPNLGIPTIRIKDWEGDDLLYVISKMSSDCIVVSDDKDLIQLIHEPTMDDSRICNIRRALNDQFWTMDTLKEMNLDIKDYIGCKAIVGDSSDNLQSACFQVGDKTALGLLNIYKKVVEDNIEFPKTEEDLKKLCEQCNVPKRKAYLNFNEQQFLQNLLMTDLQLVDDDITSDVINMIEEIITSVYNTNINIEQVNTILNELEINSLSISEINNIIKNHRDFLPLQNMEKIKDVEKIKTETGFLF